MIATPRPLAMLPLDAGAGEGRFCQPALSAAALQTFDAAFVAGEMAQAKIHRVHFEVGGDLVDETFAGETARDVAGGAQVARAQWNRFGKMPVDVMGRIS